MSPKMAKICSVKKANKNWLLWQRTSRDRKTNFRLIIYILCFTSPENLAKLGSVNVEIIGLTKIV